MAISRFGADYAINYREQDFAKVCYDQTDGRGVDVVVDIVGGDYLPREVGLLAHGGRLVIINLPAGKTATVDFGLVHSKHLTITAHECGRGQFMKKQIYAEHWKKPFGQCSSNSEITAETFATFPFSKAADAHRLMESSEHIGKIILYSESI